MYTHISFTKFSTTFLLLNHFEYKLHKIMTLPSEILQYASLKIKNILLVNHAITIPRKLKTIQ